jgi:hypothetical protein
MPDVLRQEWTAVAATFRPTDSPTTMPDRELRRWGGWAAVGGVVAMLATFVVVVGFGLPDASDPETLTDFTDLRTGRILEHFCYLAALVLLALHVLVLHRMLASAHGPAALFGTAIAELGFTALVASSVLHVATSPLADRYADAGTSAERQSVEDAWTASQAVFDTMLATGLLLVPIGLVLLGIAMHRSASFGPLIGWTAVGLGAVGTAGATFEIIEPDLELSGLSVLAMVVVLTVTGWRMLRTGR